MTTALCFIDTETTGVHRGRHVWEIAMIRREPDGRQEQTSFYVEVDLASADLFGLNIGRFYDRHPVGRWTAGLGGPYPRTDLDLGNYLSRRDAARTVAQYTHDTHLVGAVPNFDAETLGPLLREFGFVPAWHYHLIDVEPLAAGWLLGHASAMGTPLDLVTAALPPWDSDELTRHMGVAPAAEEDRHTALGDALWAMRLYDAVTGSRA